MTTTTYVSALGPLFPIRHKSTMKFTSSFAIATLFLTAVSAFGLQPSSPATKAVRRNGAFGGQKQAMVQPINLDGKQIGSEFVSGLS